MLKVADFGVSINLNAERAVTRAGTVDYMVSGSDPGVRSVRYGTAPFGTAL